MSRSQCWTRLKRLQHINLPLSTPGSPIKLRYQKELHQIHIYHDDQYPHISFKANCQQDWTEYRRKTYHPSALDHLNFVCPMQIVKICPDSLQNVQSPAFLLHYIRKSCKQSTHSKLISFHTPHIPSVLKFSDVLSNFIWHAYCFFIIMDLDLHYLVIVS